MCTWSGNILTNLFHAICLFLYPLNLWFSDVSRGYKKRPVVWVNMYNNNNGIKKVEYWRSDL